MSKPSPVCSSYTQKPHCLGAPCIRCGGLLAPHLYADVAAKRDRKRVARRSHPKIEKRPPDERIPAEIIALAANPTFGRLYRRVRLRCSAPMCIGYMVVRKRADRRYKFAGCSTYNDTRCSETIGSWEYVIRKSEAVRDLLDDRPARFPLIFVTPKPRTPKAA